MSSSSSTSSSTTSLGRLLTGEFVCAAGLLAVGVFVLAYGYRYPIIADGVVGPGLMPTITGIILTVIAAYLTWREVRAWQEVQAIRTATAAAGEPAGAETDGVLSLSDFSEDEGEAAGKPVTVAGILGMLVLAVLLAPVFGLIPMLGVLVFVCVAVFEREGLLTAALMAAGSMLLSWLLFVQLFEVPMPTGSAWQALGW
ncbi:hypothetical protein G3545_19735 [Starkeya sp. ORNL1]|uniref:tripartite tricarboxylate transporter TctB family protein n=1 Tax=Starkeya sp. ORNL1 TaxID=2709380 RepID=UPI001463062F|nr:tripartite tricarboxylate transporter TctB family protein [Starkeya sp. ORNL1]QJP15689.1 hypothetical protein G3545_19735 [Starkeya sp. ORNL1]